MKLANYRSPVVAYPKSIQFGPVTLDGYLMPDGSFRQSITSTGRAIGGSDKFYYLVSRELNKILAPANSDEKSSDALQRKESSPLQDDQDVVVPVKCPGVSQHSSTAYTINLPMVIEIWKRIAMGGGKYAQPALELLGLSAIHSLERAYQEAFGVDDSRSTNDRLVDWAVRMDAGKHFPLFAGEFYWNFARVTGCALGKHHYAQICLAELVYHRLPAKIYETLKKLNPVDETGWREFTHSQFMTDEMRVQMQAIVQTVNNQLANTPSKSEDPGAYRHLLKRLDKTLPRYTKRGAKKLTGVAA